MSDSVATVVGDAPCVLVVGDTESASDAMDVLEAQFEGITLLRERTLEGALERLGDREIHCLVCPFIADDDRTASTGTLLERLAATTDDRQIVAVTDGDDADRALAAGASDVVDRSDSEAVFAARVRNAADRERYRLAASESGRRHRSILEHAAAVVWVCDADGTIEYASPAVESRMGYTPTELERTALSRLVHPDDRDAVRDLLASVTAAPVGTTERVTLRLGHGDGTWHVSALTATNRLADPNVEGVVVTRTGTGSATDPAAGDEVRAGIDRLADALFAIGPRDELQYANRAAVRLFTDAPVGADDQDVPIGAVVWELLPDDLARQIADRVREAEATESVVEFETVASSLENRLVVSVHPADDGVSIHARERPRGAASSTVSTDRDRLELLESVVDALDDGIAVFEGSTVRLANRSLLELADADALVGRPLEELFDDELAATVRERTRSPVVRWMDPITGELAGDRPVDVFVAPLPDPDRTLCVVRDRRGGPRAALSTVRQTVAALRDAETASVVRDAVTGAVRECAGADVAVWYLVDDDRLRPAAVAHATDGTVADDQPAVEPPAFERDATSLADCLESGEATVFERGDLDGALARIGLRAERVLAVPVAERGVVLATSTEPMAFDGVAMEPLETLSDAAAVALEGLERADSLRSCRHDRSRLEAVADRAEQLRDAERSILAAETRDAVERRLCEALVALSPLESAGGIELTWVGRVDEGREAVVPATWAGRDGDFLESTTVPLGRDADVPTGAAAATHEPSVREDVTGGTGTSADEGTSRSDGTDEARTWRNRLLERGFRSALSLPLTSGEFRHGTVTAYAAEPTAFDDRTRRACRHLATVAGEAIGAIETKRALLADRITELEVVMRDDSEPLSTIARHLGRRIDVHAVVPRSSGGSTVFCSIPSGDADSIRERVDALSTVDRVSVVDHGDGTVVLEIGLTEPTVAGTIADHGGVLRSVTPIDDRTRHAIELGEPVDVRSFVRALERTHPGTELVARRERDRPPRGARPFDDLAEHLSERQRRTLEAAYYGGFFEWPREQTGEEVAESLGVSQPTFSRHLRTAQRKLFALLFDEVGRN